MSDLVKKDLGTVSAYKYAKLHGYTGTEDEFGVLMASYANVGTELDKKVDKVSGKGLSENDYTTAEKTKLAGIADEANKTLIDTTLSITGQAADAKAVGDEIDDIKSRISNIENDVSYSGGSINENDTPVVSIEFPTTYDGAVTVDNISGKIYTGGHNLMSLIGISDGTYTLNGITAEIEGNVITLSGTASSALYLALDSSSINPLKDSNVGLSTASEYNLPEISYKIGWLLNGLSNSGLALLVRSQNSGNVLEVNSSTLSVTETYDHSTWGHLYIYIPSGFSSNNGTVTVGIVPSTISNGQNYFSEYNPISIISNIGKYNLSVYSFVDGTASVHSGGNTSQNNNIEQSYNEIVSFPTTYSGDVAVSAISGTLYTGGHNLLNLIGFEEGTYTLNGLTITVSDNVITITGTASGTTYFSPFLGRISSDNSGLNEETSYDIPAISYKIGAIFDGISTGLALLVRRRTGGNILELNTTVSNTIETYDHSTWGHLYIYIPSGFSSNNGTVTVGIVPSTISNGQNYFSEYNPILSTNTIGNFKLSVYSFVDGTATVYKISEQKIEKKPRLKYISGAGDHDSVERVEIYLPTNVGYIKYNFYHSVSVQSNSNVWRMGLAYSTDDALEEKQLLTTNGEWECALHLRGRSDFSGGIAHGDEVSSNIIFFIDGTPTDIDEVTSLQEFSTLKIIQNTNLYDPLDSTTIIAKRGAEYIFDNKVTINQTINWQVAESLIACYLAMFPVAKAVTNKLYTDYNYEIITLDGSEKTINNVESCTIYSKDAGFIANFDFKILYMVNPDPTANYFLTTDNGGYSYNKCYYVLISNSSTKTTVVGELWKTQTVYNLQIVK